MTFNIACPVSKTTASHPSYANDPLNIVSEWPELVWGVNHTCCGVDCLSGRNRSINPHAQGVPRA